jgi:hypothetical protein
MLPASRTSQAAKTVGRCRVDHMTIAEAALATSFTYGTPLLSRTSTRRVVAPRGAASQPVIDFIL